jgi:polyisoprenoid-binding protein YceI
MESVQVSTTTYMIDAAASKFTVQAFASGLLSSFGHSPTFAIRDFDGSAEFRLDSLESASLRLRIQASSLSVRDDIKEKDRQEMEQTMHQEVLETAKYPEIVFETSSVTPSKIGEGQYRATISGILKLRGVAKNHTLTADLSVKGDVLHATGGFSLQQSNYGIKPVSAVGGALKVKDELKFSFDIVARR